MEYSVEAGWPYADWADVTLGMQAVLIWCLTQQHLRTKTGVIMDNMKLFLYMTLGFILFMIWEAWTLEQQELQIEASKTRQTQGQTGVPDAPETSMKKDSSVPDAPQPSLGSGQDKTQEPVALAPKTGKGQSIVVETDLLQVSINTYGGDLRSLRMKKHPIKLNEPEKGLSLFSENEYEYFIAQSGLIGKSHKMPTHKTRFSSRKSKYTLEDGQDQLSVSLFWQSPDGMSYEKIYTFYRDRYLIDIKFKATNKTGRTWQGYLYSQLRRKHIDANKGLLALPTYVGGAYYSPEDKYEKISFDDMAEEPLKLDVKNGWVAFLQHYFVTALLPERESTVQFFTRSLGEDHYSIGFKNLSATKILPGSSGELKTQIFAGSKEHARLVKLPEGMDLTVDFGILTVLSAPLFWLLVKIHGIVANWGVAIILLTILIKLVFFPLSAASYRSMAHMRRVQPKIQAIKERFGKDKQQLNKAMMEIYKREKINPLGGCLPILIQIPVFIALYWVLLESVEMRQAPFALWIHDLSAPDPFFVLPIIMGISMYIQHWLNPAVMDPVQKKIMLLMPGMFTIFFLFFPAGLVLYWVVNNILSIAQQWQITRMIEKQAKA